MVRPKKKAAANQVKTGGDAGRRSVTIQVMLTEGELRAGKARAALLGMSFREWVGELVREGGLAF